MNEKFKIGDIVRIRWDITETCFPDYQQFRGIVSIGVITEIGPFTLKVKIEGMDRNLAVYEKELELIKPIHMNNDRKI